MKTKEEIKSVLKEIGIKNSLKCLSEIMLTDSSQAEEDSKKNLLLFKCSLDVDSAFYKIVEMEKFYSISY